MLTANLTPQPRLGSLVSVKPDGREGWICAVSPSTGIYQVAFLIPRGERKDHLTDADITLLDARPVDDKRLPAGLREWIAAR